jgi:tRNA pseudouridine38-40 synthase
MLQRFAIELAYNGTDFFGWQIQPKQISVQEEIEKQLSRLLGNEPAKITGCGRTDTGVHASYYVAHFDTTVDIDPETLLYKLNKMLPKSIVLYSIQAVSEEFHARFSAKKRQYTYTISQLKDPFNLNQWFLKQELDLEKMNQACELLLGTKDFTTFSKLHTDVKTNICTVFSANWVRIDSKIEFKIEADRFLRNMVRAIVGTLVDVGLNKISLVEFEQAITSMNRSNAGMSAPGQALFLSNIEYDDSLFQRKL